MPKLRHHIAEFPDDKRTILYFDTEQSPHHCQHVMKRALQLTGLPLDSHPKNLIFSQLRALTPEIRLELVDNAIAHCTAITGGGFPISLYPCKIQRIIREVTDCYGFSVDYVAAAMLVAVSVAIGNTHILRG